MAKTGAHGKQPGSILVETNRTKQKRLQITVVLSHNDARLQANRQTQPNSAANQIIGMEAGEGLGTNRVDDDVLYILFICFDNKMIIEALKSSPFFEYLCSNQT